jgi:hypothetical protein
MANTANEQAAPQAAWKPEEFEEPRREFRGRIVRAEWGSADPKSPHYNEWVFLPEAPEDVRERQVERQAYAIRVEIMPLDKAWQNLYEWYGISRYRLTKWYYFIDALGKTKAPYSYDGNTEEERLDNFCKSLIGMEFKWLEHTDLPTMGRRLIKRLLLPIEFYGRTEVKEVERIKL